MLEVVSVLTSFHRNHARIKMLRVSISVIRFLSLLNRVFSQNKRSTATTRAPMATRRGRR